jgi:acyl carrier protein
MTEQAAAPVRERVRRIIEDLNPSGADVTGESRLIDDLAFNSLALLELMFACEDEFGLPPIDEVASVSISTVADVESYVEAEVGRLSSADSGA